ncbi:hypothetical protein [Vulgatibacter sp.]|uniref:hypothetical protein n=1 Tax=Vulgatibacter sp. TaxID=1971226 RepID=UPI003565615B
MRFVAALCLIFAAQPAAAFELGATGSTLAFGKPGVELPPPAFEADLWYAGEVPPCTTADACVLDCWADGAGSFDCTDGSAAAVAVTPGVGATTEDTPWRTAAGVDLKGTTATTTTAAATVNFEPARAALGGDHTLIVVSQPRVPGSAAAPAQILDANNTGLFLQFTGGGGTPECKWRQEADNGGYTAISSQSGIDVWGVGACRRQGTTYTARWNGTASSKTWAGSPLPAVGTPLTIGKSGSTPANGPVLNVRLYNVGKSDTFLAQYEAQIAGTWAARPGVPVTVARSTPRPAQDDEGNWHVLGPNMGSVNREGLGVWESATSYWPNSTTPSLWADSASTPTVNGTEIVDDSTTDMEGKFRIVGVSSPGPWTITCLMSAGSIDRGMLRLYTDEAGKAVTCNVGGLTSEARPHSCSTTLTTATYVQGLVWPGQGSADTGSIRVEQCQLTPTAKPTARVDCGSSVPCTAAAEAATVPTTNWPATPGTALLTYTPTVPLDLSKSYFLLSGEAYPTTGWSTYVRNGDSQATIIPTGTAANVAMGSSLAWVPGTPYVLRHEWGGTSLNQWRDGVQNYSSSSFSQPLAPLPAVGCIGGRAPTCGQVANGRLRNIRLH